MLRVLSPLQADWSVPLGCPRITSALRFRFALQAPPPPQPECSVQAAFGVGPPKQRPVVRKPRTRLLPESNTHMRLGVGAGMRSISVPVGWNRRLGTI